MKPYLVRIRCQSPYLTPWRNATLWGRLSWIIASGAVAGWEIKDWIQFYREGMAPLVVGDGFPADAVPVPAAFLAAAKGPQTTPKTLPWSQWLGLCRTGMWPEETGEPSPRREVERQHVTIDRSTGTAAEGQLRTEKGDWPADGVIFVALIDDALGPETFERMIAALCAEGWGYGRSYGYGHIDLAGIEPLEPPAPTGCFVTLGHCHPTDDLPAEGWWRWKGVPVRRHDPQTRRGPAIQFTTMLAPGATFVGDADSFPRFVGHIVYDPLPDNDHYAHNGLAPVWSITLSEASHE